MNSSTKLDSAVFQLTPTRTRFDLVINMNRKKEKIASGLLNPFLSHLKAAQDQMAKGGYSIVLEPDGSRDATWFTKGTVERFVRFVSTPEILERVYTTESEILQIEEAIAIQGNNCIGISTAEENQVKHVENTEATPERTSRKTVQDTNEERAIVLYKPDAEPPAANGSTIASEENSKAHLLKVLESRKSVLQKEQGMAFARAVAAGFDIDHMPALVSFAECFGASRLLDACSKYRDLWKRKHETGQWLEIEAAEMMSNHSDFPALNTSNITFPIMASTPHTESDSGNNGKANSDVPPMGQPSLSPGDNSQGQFPHPMFPPWPVHSPLGAVPVFPPYPVQGIPYYQAYPGNSPYMQPNYSPMEDPRFASGQNMRHRRHSMDSRHINTESETCDVETSKSRLQDEADIDRDGSQSRDRQKKGSRSGRKKSGMVVIRNINYITKAENSSGSESYSDSGSEIDEGQDAQESVNTLKRRGRSESAKRLNLSDKEVDHGNDADGGHWQAFQSCLLRDADDDRHAIDQEQFDLPNANSMRRKKHVVGDDPLVSSERDMHELQGSGSIDMHSISKGLTLKPRASGDDLSLSVKEGHSSDGRSIDVQSLEVNGIRRGYRTVGNDDFIVPNHEGHFGNSHPSSDMEAVSGLGYSNNKMERKLFHDMNDDSYIVDHRSVAVNDVGHDERNAIDMDSEFPTAHLKEEKSSNGINYEPDELSMMPERGAETVSMSYDPALDYEMMAEAEGSSLQDKNNKGVVTEESTKPDKEQKSKVTPNSSDKKKAVGTIRRGKPSKLSPLDEARARADRLRNYKADLQKMKKEKEEEEIKRLEALKLERQKRIAAKSGTVTTKSPVTKKQLPAKLSPSSHKGSKFSDLEPGPSSPLQRFPVQTAAAGSSDYSKVSRTSKLNTGSQSSENKLSRSVSSLPESKLEKGEGTTDTKASMARIRRLSEPKMSTFRQTSSAKPHNAGTISKTKSVDGPESKKISAIVSYDKSKTAALPELKIRTSTASDVVQNKSSVKEKAQKSNGNKSSVNLDSTLAKKNETQTSPSKDLDDNHVVEKTVVILECEKPYAPAIHKSEEKTETLKKQYDNEDMKEKFEPASSYVAIRAPVSPPSLDMTDTATSGSQSHLPHTSTGVKLNDKEKEHSKSFNISVAEETYQAPYARVSSLEDPSTRNTEYGKAVPTVLEATAIGGESVKAHVSDTRNSTLEKIPEAVEKPQVKESSKGFRRLLKFGKKSRSSANSGHNVESDNASNDGAEADQIGTNGSSIEVHTLKNLISQDETPTTSSTQQKSSRSFSLLSPFRSKNSEKKINMA